MELRLVADTNIFLECRPLEDLPWRELGHDPVVVLLAKPVLDEIDKHKKATGRTRARALEVFGRIRAMLRDGRRESEIRASSPRVVLRLLEATAPDARHAGLLDYGRPDDKLVGIVSALQDGDPTCETQLFTDDTGPASTAADLRLPFRMVDDRWRRPPAEGTESKRIRELEKDLATYRTQEPEFVIAVPGRDEGGPTRSTRRVAVALTGSEIDEIVAALHAKHPAEVRPTIPGPIVERMASGETVRTTYHPPAEDEVARYRDAAHPDWTRRCRDALGKLHEGRSEKEPRVAMRWSIANVGTRPASRVRVVFEAKGRLRLVRIARKDGDAPEGSVTPAAIATERLPPPPPRPALRTEVTRTPPPPAPATTVPAHVRAALAAHGGAIASREMLERSGVFREDALTAFRARDLLSFTGSLEALGVAKDLGPHLGASGVDWSGAGSLARMAEADWALRRANAVTPSLLDLASLGPLRRPAHEPEAFYWDWPADEAVIEGALTRDLWRHGMGAEPFEFEVVFDGDGAIDGAVGCVVHAENLTKPVRATVPVGRTIERIDLRALAGRLVETCG